MIPSAHRLASILLAAAALALGACAQAPQATPARMLDASQAPESILWAGNSFFYYNNSMHGHFGRFVAASGTGAKMRGTSVTISGAGIDWHDIDSLLRPDGLGRYVFQADNSIKFSQPGRQYDTAILMDCSQCPIHPQLQSVFHETVRKDVKALTKAGVRPVLFMSWAYKDKPEMTAQLAEQYQKAAKDNGARVIPAGIAFAKSVAKRPDIELYDADKRHPSLAGTYLGAATAYATLYRKSPETYNYTAGLDPAVAQHLRATAWEAAQEVLAQ